MNQVVGYEQFGKLYIQCMCGHNGFAIKGVCKNCKRKHTINMERDYQREVVGGIKIEESDFEISATITLDKLVRVKKSISLRKNENEFDVIFVKKDRKLHVNVPGNPSESWCPYQEQLGSFMQRCFAYAGIHHTHADDLLKQENGFLKCRILLQYPVLQNSPFDEYQELPTWFSSQLETIHTGNELWDLLTGHRSKKVKELASTVDSFNALMLFGPRITQPENAANLLKAFNVQHDTDVFRDISWGTEMGDLMVNTLDAHFLKGLSLIQDMNKRETVWVNKLISFIHAKGYSASQVSSYLADIGRMFEQVKEKINHAELTRYKSIERVHDFLSHQVFILTHENKEISYTEIETKWETTQDNYSFQLARDTHELLKVGADMHICVGSYGEKAVEKDCSIVLLRDSHQEEPVVCIEIEQNAIVQAKMRYNELPTPELKEVILQWAEQHELQNETHDLGGRSRGMRVPNAEDFYEILTPRMHARHQRMVEEILNGVN